jgi:hypothetical protein
VGTVAHVNINEIKSKPTARYHANSSQSLSGHSTLSSNHGCSIGSGQCLIRSCPGKPASTPASYHPSRPLPACLTTDAIMITIESVWVADHPELAVGNLRTIQIRWRRYADVGMTGIAVVNRLAWCTASGDVGNGEEVGTGAGGITGAT